MISYNVFLVNNNKSGWRKDDDNSVLVIQNENITELDINPFIQQLRDEMKTFDLVVIYIGSSGAGFLVEFAKKCGVVPEKTVFVMCRCNLSTKKTMLSIHGFHSSKIVPCDCGGFEVMLKIFEEVLYLGETKI